MIVEPESENQLEVYVDSGCGRTQKKTVGLHGFHDFYD